jgi:hypothetical protein
MLFVNILLFTCCTLAANNFCFIPFLFFLCDVPIATTVGDASFLAFPLDQVHASSDPNHHPVIELHVHRRDSCPAGGPAKDSWVDDMNFEAYYPELLGYNRRGNGYVSCDATPVFIGSRTNADGLGGLYLQFPARRDPIYRDPKTNLGMLDGLHHPSNSAQWHGYSVRVYPMQNNVEFPPEPRTNVWHHLYVPKSRSGSGLYIDYTGIPDTSHAFTVFRCVLWDGAWEPPALFSDKFTHQEL